MKRICEADFIINDAAKCQLDKLGALKQLPKRKDVVAEIQSLISEKNECYNDYREKSDRLHQQRRSACLEIEGHAPAST